MEVFKHYSEYPIDKWRARWPNFTPKEIASKGEGELGVHEESLDRLQEFRNLMGVPIIVNSAYRSERHNRRVGGAEASQHLMGRAFDIRVRGHNPADIEHYARKAGFTGTGFYKGLGFIHIDTGPERQWGDRWYDPAAITPVAKRNEQKVITLKRQKDIDLWNLLVKHFGRRDVA